MFLLLWLPLAYLSHLIGVFLTAVQPSAKDPEPSPVEPPPPAVITVMLLGVDTQDMDQPKAAVRSDVIVVGTIDLDNRQVKLLSIPRDT